MKGVVNITMEMFKPQSTGMFSTIHILAKLLNRFSLEASLTWTGRRLYCRSIYGESYLRQVQCLVSLKWCLALANLAKLALLGVVGFWLKSMQQGSVQIISPNNL